MISRKSVLGLLAVLALSAGSVRAMDLMSFSFSDLHGVYDGASLLTVDDAADTDGEVTRLVPTVGDAFFSGDGVSGIPGLAAFNMTMTISAVTATTASGNGTITFTDAQGDTFSGNVFGDWHNITGSANFVGQLMGFTPNNSSGDGTFDGSDSGSFDMTFDVAPPYTGNIITLVAGNWFDAIGFETATTLAIGAITPEPGTLALLAIGGLLAARRRQ